MEIKADLKEVTPRTVACTDWVGYGNVGGIELQNYTIAIDSSMYSKTGKAFYENLRKYFSKPVRFLLYTHYHGDHVFGSGSFKDLTIISSEQTSKNLRDGLQLGWKQALEEEDPLAEGGLEISYPTIKFSGKLFIEDGDFLVEVYNAGGHTSGSSIVYFPYERVLFSGDLIFADSFPYGGDPTCNPDTWIEQLERLKEFEAEKIIPGHGPVLDDINEIDKHVEFLKGLRKAVKEAVKENIDPEDVSIPEFFEKSAEGRKPVTVEQWYEFYKNKL
ncbi:MAG: MBL fold metallo-hydrolase [Candidatus Odinarchaeota archaeon]